MKKYDPSKPSDVREFTQKIARMMNSGPAGAVQAKRLLKEMAQTHQGAALVKSLREYTKILSESSSVNLKSVKVNTGNASDQAAKQLGAKAFSSGHEVFSGSSAGHMGFSTAVDLVAHEVAHTLQQSKRD